MSVRRAGLVGDEAHDELHDEEAAMENLVILAVLGSIGLFLFVVIVARRSQLPQTAGPQAAPAPQVRSAPKLKAEFDAALEELSPVFGDQLRKGLEDVRSREAILKEVGAYQAAAQSALQAERQRYYREFLAEQEAKAHDKAGTAA